MVPHSVNGLPLHALAVHAAVVLVPLATLLAVLFVIPRTRAWSGLAMALVSVAAAGAVLVAKLSGQNLKATLQAQGGGRAWEQSDVGRAVLHHQSLANQLFVMMLVFAVVAVVVYALYRNPRWFSGGVQVAACAVLLAGAVLVAIWTFRAGEAGAKAVWNPAGTSNFGSAPFSAR